MAQRKGMFGEGREDRSAYLPSEEEILQRAAALRRKWKPRTYRKRGAPVQGRPIDVREYTTEELFGVLRESQSE